MKPLLPLTALAVLLISPLSHAQNGSGSGNGNGNRDVLGFRQEIDQSRLSLTSIEEEMARLNAELEKLKSRTAHPPQDASDFWTRLTDPGRQVALDYSAHLQSAIQGATKAARLAQDAIQRTMDDLDAILSDSSQFRDRGIERDFKKKVRETRRELQEDGDNLVGDILEPLFSPFVDSGAYFKRCDTALCIDLLYQQAMDYSAFVRLIADKKVEIAGKQRSVADWYKRQYPKRVCSGNQCVESIEGTIFERYTEYAGKHIRKGEKDFRELRVERLFQRGQN